MNGSDISVVLPVFNQADHIEEVVRGFHHNLQRVPAKVELVLVVNGSQRDNSIAICQNLSNTLSNVHLIVSKRGGWGRAVRLGLERSSGEILCYTNSARTTVEDLVLVLLYALAFPEAVIKANRKIRENLKRRLGSLVYNLECRNLFDLPYWDINGTPKVFPRRFAALLELKRDDDLIDLEFNLRCREQDYPVLEVPIFSKGRERRRSTTTLKSALRMYVGAWSIYRKLHR